jgi:hypothetical protein
VAVGGALFGQRGPAGARVAVDAPVRHPPAVPGERGDDVPLQPGGEPLVVGGERPARVVDRGGPALARIAEGVEVHRHQHRRPGQVGAVHPGHVVGVCLLDGERPTAAGAEPGDRAVLGAGEHHPVPGLAEQPRRAERDGEGRLLLGHRPPADHGADRARVGAAVPGVQEHGAVPVPAQRDQRRAGTGRERGVERDRRGRGRRRVVRARLTLADRSVRRGRRVVRQVGEGDVVGDQPDGQRDQQQRPRANTEAGEPAAACPGAVRAVAGPVYVAVRVGQHRLTNSRNAVVSPTRSTCPGRSNSTAHHGSVIRTCGTSA